MSRAAAHVLPALALVLVMASAFAQGGETLAGQGLVLAAGAAGFACLALAPPAQWPPPLQAAAAAWALLVVWTFIQAAPFGLGAHPAWQAAQAVLAEPMPGSIALDPYASVDAALRLAAYAGLFALGLVSATMAAPVAGWIVLGTAVIAGVSLLAGDQPLGPAGLAKVRHWGDAAYPFANRNHFCVFAGIGGLTAAGTLLASPERRHPVAAFLIAMALLVCLAGAFASHSRAGLASLAAGAAVTLALMLPGRRTLLAAATLAVAAAAVFAAGTIARFETFADAAALRLDIIGRAFDLSLHRPWLGSGSFDLAFQAVSPAYPQGLVQSAHNILAGSLVERGWPATAAAVLALLLVLGQCARSIPGGSASRVRGATAIGVATMVLLHGMVDFSVHAPTIAALVAIMLGLGAGPSWQPAPVPAVTVARGDPPDGARA